MSENVKAIGTLVTFNLLDEKYFGKTAMMELAKKKLAENIALAIFKNIDEMPLEIMVRDIPEIMEREYSTKVTLVSSTYLHEMEEKLRKYQTIPFSADMPIIIHQDSSVYLNATQELLQRSMKDISLLREVIANLQNDLCEERTENKQLRRQLDTIITGGCGE